MYDHYPATEKQQAFITSLVDDRECDKAAILADLPTMSKKKASEIISHLLAAPKRPKAATAAGASKGNPSLTGMIKSRYAVPTSEFAMVADLPGLDTVKGDLIFVEVKEYRGTVYMRRLHGSLGDFTRSRLPREAVDALAGIIKTDAYRYVRLFGEHYCCCGKCGSPLTDEKSRALLLGPDCRKAFGY